MDIIDISMALKEGMIVYEGDPDISLRKAKDITEDGVNVTEVQMGLHTGTHIDAPSHFIEGGDTIDQISLKRLCGDAIVIDATSAKSGIEMEDVELAKIKEGDIVLFKTRNGTLMDKPEFSREFIYLGSEVADHLIESGVNAVGIDYLSIDSFDSDDPTTHNSLLGAGIPIIEGLDLRKVEPGRYQAFCMPLRFLGTEAAPARCILVR